MEYLRISPGQYDFCAQFSQTAALEAIHPRALMGLSDMMAYWAHNVTQPQRQVSTGSVSSASSVNDLGNIHAYSVFGWVPCHKVLHVLQPFLSHSFQQHGAHLKECLRHVSLGCPTVWPHGCAQCHLLCKKT